MAFFAAPGLKTQELSGAHAAGLPDVRAMFTPDPTDTLRFSRDTGEAPERRLALAVMTRALLELRNYPPGMTGKREGAGLHEQARHWFLSTDPTWPFSFVSICALFDLDPAAVRRSVVGPDAALEVEPSSPRRKLRVVRR